MPSKQELERENEELRAQLAMLGGRTPDVPGCTESCAHGIPYHGAMACPGDVYIDTPEPCLCPIHSPSAKDVTNPPLGEDDDGE